MTERNRSAQPKYRASRSAARQARRKKNKRINVVLFIIIIAAAAVFIFAAVNVIIILTGYAKAKNTYREVADEVISIEEISSDSETSDEISSKKIHFNFDLLRARCKDAVGYIYQEDILSYPIVQYTDNDYYLHHLIDDTYSSNGTLFVDYRNTGGLNDRNSIVYGHNMNDGSMFGRLSRYSDYSYFEKYPEMDVFIGYKHYIYKVFSVYTAEVDSISYQYSFTSDDNFLSYLSYTKSQSLYDTGIDYDTNSEVITLSTCTSNSADAYRFVVILIRDREVSD